MKIAKQQSNLWRHKVKQVEKNLRGIRPLEESDTVWGAVLGSAGFLRCFHGCQGAQETQTMRMNWRPRAKSDTGRRMFISIEWLFECRNRPSRPERRRTRQETVRRFGEIFQGVREDCNFVGMNITKYCVGRVGGKTLQKTSSYCTK